MGAAEETKKGLQSIQGGLPANVDTSAFFDEEVVSDRAQDTLIPVLRLVHGVSKIMQEGKALAGDIIDSISIEALANKDKAIEFIPVKEADKTFTIERFNGKKWEFVRTDPYDPKLAGFEQREFEETHEDGKTKIPMRRNQRLNFYVLLARDATTGKFPYMISFQRTSYTAGRTLASFFTEQLGNFKEAKGKGDIQLALKFIPQVQVFSLKSKHVVGPDGPYYVMEVTRGRVATEAERDRAIYWTKQLMQAKGSYKVHEETPEADVEFSGDTQTEERF